MTLTKRSKVAAVLAGGALLAGALGAGISGTTASAAGFNGRHLHAHIDPLNNSGVTGKADIKFDGKRGKVSIEAKGLMKGVPHAIHIHFANKARNECPSVRDDINFDHRLTATEGGPAYGPFRVSVTTKGDTSPASGLALDRFPTTPKGKLDYDRTFKFKNRKDRRGIKNGKGVLVIHGLDYNNNGIYDFDAGTSELDPALPAEGTDTAACGVLKVRD
jgi:hypothetical protein